MIIVSFDSDGSTVINEISMTLDEAVAILSDPNSGKAELRNLAFDLVHEQYTPRCAAIAHTFLLDQNFAEDIILELFLGYYKERETIRSVKEFDHWIFSRLASLCLQKLKKIPGEEYHKRMANRRRGK